MGSQQIKSDDEDLSVEESNQLSIAEKCCTENAEQKLMNESTVRKNVFKQNLRLELSHRHSIKVANFAKIKTEPQTGDDHLNDETEKKVKSVDKNIFLTFNEIAQSDANMYASNIEEEQFDQEKNSYSPANISTNLSNIKVKEELLESHCSGIENRFKAELQQDEITSQNEAAIAITDEDESEKTKEYSLIKTEITDGTPFPKSLQNECIIQTHTVNFKETRDFITLESSGDEEEALNNHSSNNLQFVKNPLAFLRKKRNKVSAKEYELIVNTSQKILFNTSVKAEPIVIDDKLETSRISKSPPTQKNTNKDIILIKTENTKTSINFNELNIKSENFNTFETNQEIYNDTNLHNACVNCSLASSLDVNVSNVDSDFDDALCTQSIEDETSNISSDTNLEPLHYFPKIEISSEENDELSQLTTNTAITKKQKSYKSILRRTYKRGAKIKITNSSKGKKQKPNKEIGKRKQGKTNRKLKQSIKNRKRDTAYKSSSAIRSIVKNLPKTDVKTRQKTTKSTDNKGKKNTNTTKEDFPKPLKLEYAALQKDCSIALELPKPMLVKSEWAINNTDKKSYLQPKFQPYVLLKRLKSEELLMPLKTNKHVRNRRNFKRTTNQIETENRRDFLIHQAFSLNPSIKFNRISLDHDRSYYNDTPSESPAQTDSKYFTAQDLFLHYHSSTPKRSHTFSGPIDSGVSTSTPSMCQHSAGEATNKTLLLKIAAERAFINNHLMHFGYSPVQFDLYNNLNDLSVFLKYLFGNVNTN